MDVFWIPRSHVQESASLRPRSKPADELLLDEQTFRDLEIFGADGDDKDSLFALFNRTRTGGGEKLLRTRWLRPFSSASRIRAVQDSIRFIIADDRAFNHLPGDSVVLAVEHYLYSGLAMSDATHPFSIFLEGIEARVGNFRGYWKMVTGVQRTAHLIHRLQALVASPSLQDAPGELGEKVAEMRTLLDRPAFVGLPEEGDANMPFWKIAPIDNLLRNQERPTIELLLRLVFEIDALLAMAIAVRDFGLIIPEVHAGDTEVVAEGVWHPFIERPVPNPLRIDQDKRLLFVTGPNMAGKTTYLRACGAAIYLAHLGMGVPAQSFRFAPCNSLFSAITLTDNIRDGISFFQAEAMRLKAIAQALADGRRVIALLDEPFMGTNVKDAMDASRGILSRLAARHGSIFLVSSHLIELGDALLATGSAECRHFEAMEDGSRLEFDYIIREGISTQRLGVRVLEEAGIFSLLDEG